MPISNGQTQASGGGGTTFTAVNPLELSSGLLSIQDSSSTQKGVLLIQNSLSDVTSTTRAATPNYVRSLIEYFELNPNKLDNVFIACKSEITLSGSVTYESIVIPDGSRVLAAGQTDQTTNGIYIASDSGVWSRSSDADTPAELFLAQTAADNGDAGLYLCIAPKDMVIGTTDIQFIELYQTNNSAIGIKAYQSTIVYMSGNLVAYNDSIYQCLTDDTLNDTPSNSSANWVQIVGFVEENYAKITSNGLDDKGNNLPYATVQAAIDDLTNPTIDSLNATTTEVVTLKTNTYLRGENATLNGVINNSVSGCVFKDYTINGTNSNPIPLIINGGSNFNYTNLTATSYNSDYSISISGAWDGKNYIIDGDYSGDINIGGTTAAGVIYFQDIYSTLTLTLNCANAIVYVHNCPNFTLVETAGTIISNSQTGLRIGTATSSTTLFSQQQQIITVTWNAAFADTDYLVNATVSSSNDQPLIINLVNNSKTTTDAQFIVTNLGAQAVDDFVVEAIAQHN